MSTIKIDREKLETLLDFIDRALSRQWDHHTDMYLCPDVSWENGKRSMDPDMYDLAEELRKELWQDADPE